MKKFQPVLLVVLSLFMTVSGLSKIGSQYQMQLGNPSSSTTDPANHKHYLIVRDQYAMDYSDELGEPNWVSWDLTAEDIGSSGRSSFIQDTTLPSGFYQVKTTDYSGSGYDRGHMCPSADRTVTAADNQVLFYMSNMVPQTPDNNQGVWNNFESYCRGLTVDGSELLIISGPSLFNGSRIPTNAAAIPGDVWKIVVVVPAGAGTALERITATTRVIAISIPNIAGVRSDPWQNYLTSVAQIEADTGFSFFGNLRPEVASALRTVVDGQSSASLPVITGQPVSQSAPLGGSATFSVAATGTGSLSYQWFKDGDLLAGATGASLSLTGVTLADAGSYDVVVTNASGSTVSRAADLTISGLPPGISSAPVSQTVNAGSSLTLAVVASGSAPFTYQWRKDGADIGGATASTLALTDIQASSAGAYEVVVSNANGSLTSSPAVLTVTDIAPVITGQPTARTGALGGSISLAVIATGTKPMSYQWRKDGAPLADDARHSGSSAAQLTISNLVAGDAGSYDVVVTNSLNSATSSPAALTVSTGNIIWDFAAATPLASSVPAGLTVSSLTQGNNNGSTTLLTTTSASSVYPGATGGGNAGAAARTGSLNLAANGSAYFEFTLTPASGQQVQVTGVSFGSRSTSTGPQAYAVYSSLDAYSAPLATGTLPNNSAWALYTPAFKMIQAATNTAVTLRLYAYNGTGSPAAGTANWRIDDLKVSAVALVAPPAVPTVVSTNPADGSTGVAYNTGITVSFDQPVTLSNAWFTLSSASQGLMAASITGGPSVYVINPPSGFQLDDQVTLVIHADQVADRATGLLHPVSDTRVVFRTAAPQAPGIASAPASVTVTEGAAASFSVVASGSAPFAYQWRKDGVALSGNASATTAFLQIGAATSADAGSYDCVVSNSVSLVTSPSASLTVTPLPPAITLQPLSIVQPAGSEAVFLVAAKGSAPLSYQWRRSGVALTDSAAVSGSTSPELHLLSPDLFSAGQYDVVVSNAGGSVTSGTALLTITDPALAAVAWNFTTATPSGSLPSYIQGGAVAQGNNNGTTTLLTTTSVSSGYAGASGSFNAGAAARTGALSQAAGGSAYFEFTVSPAADRQLLVSGLSLGMRSTGTGPQAFAVFSSLDGFTSPLFLSATPNNSTWGLKNVPFQAQVGPVGQPVTLRIYGYNGAGSPAAGTANWRIDDLQVYAKTIAVPPVVTTAPAGQSLTVGETLRLTVAASGSAPFTYQWRKDGAALGGATKPVLEVAGVRSADAGAYDCVVTNDGGSVASPAATVSVAKATVDLQLDALQAVYDGSPKPVLVSSAVPVSAIVVTYDGLSGAPINAGSYTVSAVIDDPDYQGSASGTLMISKAPVSISIDNVEQIYDGGAHSVAVSTTPSGVSVAVTYNGSTEAPVAAGSYAVEVLVTDPNRQGSSYATLVVAKAKARILLTGLVQPYDGTPRTVVAETVPAGLKTVLSYDGETSAPSLPGLHSVSAVIDEANYSGSAEGQLRITTAALVRHAPVINGEVEGSVQVLLPEGVTLNGNAALLGDLLVPGVPTLVLNGRPAFGGLVESSGAALPTGQRVTLNGGAVLRHLVTRVDPIAMPAVPAPVSPTGSRSVTLGNTSQLLGDATDLRNLTLNGNEAAASLPAGSYGSIVLNGNSVLTLGTAGSDSVAVYDLGALTLNGSSSVRIAGPVLLTLGSQLNLNSVLGNAEHPEWLLVRVAGAGVTLNGASRLHGSVQAPDGTVSINGSSVLQGELAADRLTINGNGLLEQLQ